MLFPQFIQNENHYFKKSFAKLIFDSILCILTSTGCFAAACELTNACIKVKKLSWKNWSYFYNIRKPHDLKLLLQPLQSTRGYWLLSKLDYQTEIKSLAARILAEYQAYHVIYQLQIYSRNLILVDIHRTRFRIQLTDYSASIKFVEETLSWQVIWQNWYFARILDNCLPGKLSTPAFNIK